MRVERREALESKWVPQERDRQYSKLNQAYVFEQKRINTYKGVVIVHTITIVFVKSSVVHWAVSAGTLRMGRPKIPLQQQPNWGSA